jgi:transposase-like protein
MEKEMSEEPRRKWDRYSAEFRQQALERMKTCDNVKALAKELGVAKLARPKIRAIDESGS